MMKETILTSLVALLPFVGQAQTTSCASFLRTQPKGDVAVPFRYADTGTPTPMEWGLDLAWRDENNVRRGVYYAGQDVIDIVRLSFQPTSSVEDGVWSDEQLADLAYRADAVLKWCKKGVGYNLNDDHASVAPWYNAAGTPEMRGERWAKLIDMAADYYKSRGLTNLVSISPFNEPDFGWGQGYSDATRKADFKAICTALKQMEKYKDVRMCGGNTLNDDCALDWYRYLSDVLDEGNTHQLAGDFDHYADFFQTVRAEGKHATADELHNVMEAMVGVEYGLQTGIWWGTCERARAEFMKATYHAAPGARLAYAEHRPNWTSAAVYRQRDGRVQAFGGMSERQSATTDYHFLATDRTVWWDGERGRDFVMHLPGGTGYQNGQTGAEVCVEVQGGRDVMPHIGEGVYKLMNVNSGLVAGYTAKPTSGWQALLQRKNDNTAKAMQWVVKPLHATGDFSYYTFMLNTADSMYLDVKNGNLDEGAETGVYPGGGNYMEQFYLDYAGNGSFYIRSRCSTRCLEVKNGSKLGAAAIQLGEYKGEARQQWRFIDVKTVPNLVPPAAPTRLTATPQSASVLLSWDAPADKDLRAYTVLRAEQGDTAVLANHITSTLFVDNEAEPAHEYTYMVYAEDKSLNRSALTEGVEAAAVGGAALVAHLPLEGSLCDTTENANHAAFDGTARFATTKDHTALSFDGTQNFLQLPYTVANSDELTVSLWVYYRGGRDWQRIFDFGNGQQQYMFLTPDMGQGMRFAMKNGGQEQQLTTNALVTSRWNHIAVVVGQDGARLYLNGKLKAENTAVDIRPSDIRPTLNYIGRSQFPADPLFKGEISDVRIYNHALTPEQVDELATGLQAPLVTTNGADTPAYDLSGRRAGRGSRGIVVKDGKKTVRR